MICFVYLTPFLYMRQFHLISSWTKGDKSLVLSKLFLPRYERFFSCCEKPIIPWNEMKLSQKITHTEVFLISQFEKVGFLLILRENLIFSQIELDKLLRRNYLKVRKTFLKIIIFFLKMNSDFFQCCIYCQV